MSTGRGPCDCGNAADNRGEPLRARGGVVPVWEIDGIGLARRAVASARGTEPAIDLAAESGAGEPDIVGFCVFLGMDDIISEASSVPRRDFGWSRC